MARTTTRICETKVNKNVLRIERQNVLLRTIRSKFSRPTKCNVVLPTVASDTL
ncbi:hypothetical protein D9M69_597930 [compost metagenome]